MCRRSPDIKGAVVKLPESSSISASVRDALAVIHQQALELIVRGASLDAVLEALCDGIDALDPDSSHVPMLSQPGLVIDVIRAAARSVQGASAAV